MVHNGVIAKLHAKDTEKSDTVLLTEMLKAEHIKFHQDKQVTDKLQRFVGHFNILTFLDNEGNCVTINKERGVHKDGLWFSNSSYTTWYGWIDLNYGITTVKSRDTEIAEESELIEIFEDELLHSDSSYTDSYEDWIKEKERNFPRNIKSRFRTHHNFICDCCSVELPDWETRYIGQSRVCKRCYEDFAFEGRV
jgi:hypothetical protein